MFNKSLILLTAIACAIILPSHKTDEGMFPLSQINQVDFKAAGFNITQKDIYNPNGIALTDALVRLGGCTGSFVSNEGLIITNHHCVFGSVAGVSTKENDYLENGFYASDKSKEIKVPLTCKITKSYEDVSIKVLDGINLNTDPSIKKDMIRKNIDALIKTEQALYPELSIEVSEMFVGYSYTLFRYQVLKDVRLVYVPPRTIGEFGGETDNWEWPKHTGDFSIVRAYVGKDGKPADYNIENIPYTPKKFLKINPKGTQNNDLVFILGYPGTTFRNEPAQFLKYQQDYILPFISEWYGWRIKTMEDLGKSDRNRYLKLAGNIKQLANTKKNYEGKIFGLSQTSLQNTKMDEQMQLIEKMKKAGANVAFFSTIDSLYKIRLRNAKRDLLLNRFNIDCGTLASALNIENSKKGKAPSKDSTAFWNQWKKSRLQSLAFTSVLDNELDQLTLIELIKRAKALPKNESVKALKKIKNPEKWVKQAFDKSFFDESAKLRKLIDSVPWVVYNTKDPITKLATDLLPVLTEIDTRNKDLNNKLSALLPRLLEAKINYGNKKFIPDANATLRFTYGYISGYKEGLNKHTAPYTHRYEIFEKNATDNVDYRLSEPVKNVLNLKNIDPSLLDPSNGDLIVCMLYNMDTTGGNSGSPVMDADGNLVGVNFDRAYTATLNDYSWNADYSRSIAVDIRYVLFTMKYLSNANNLLTEMGVTL